MDAMQGGVRREWLVFSKRPTSQTMLMTDIGGQHLPTLQLAIDLQSIFPGDHETGND